ncbi:hypothetical protein RFI_32212, partial [Reticulomyxa filosa]
MDHQNSSTEQNQKNLTTLTPFQGFNELSTPLNKIEKQSGQSQHITTSTLFQSLKDLPTPLDNSQCVLHKHELLICGGYVQRACYSYHTLKNEYNNVELYGHCVVKLADNNKDSNQITLVSFGGDAYTKRHTLVMKYVSVWSNENDNNKNDNDNHNQWIPFTDNHNHPIIIGRDNDNYEGMRA